MSCGLHLVAVELVWSNTLEHSIFVKSMHGYCMVGWNETQSDHVHTILFRLCPLAENGRVMKGDIVFTGYLIPAGVGGMGIYMDSEVCAYCVAFNHSLILCTADHNSIPWDSDGATS